MTVKLNNIKYLLVEIPIIDKKDPVYILCDKYKCIFQGVIQISPKGFFTPQLLAIKILVPEKAVIDFSNEYVHS